MKIDFHLHSSFSWDSSVPILEYVKVAEERQFGAISIADHNSTKSHSIIDKLQQNTEVILVPGQEISTRNGHLLVYGWVDQIEPGLPMKETVNIAKKSEGYAVAAHPFDPFRSGSYSKVFETGVDGIETLNASTWLPGINWIAKRALNKQHNVFGTGNSDAHRLGEFGTSWTEIPESYTITECLNNLSEGLVKGKRLGIRRKLSRFIKRKF